MKRRFNDDEDFDEDLFPDINGEDDMNEELTAEYIKVLDKREMVEALKLQLVQKEINHIVLSKVLEYLEKKWTWRFKSLKNRLNLIVETYQTFKALVDIDTQYEEETEEDI